MIVASHGIIGSSIGQVVFVGLLDDYPNAAAAYSLRKLRGAYTGSAIRVRRASDSTELNIGFSANQLDTSALTTFCSGTNGFVTTWYDQSGNNKNLSQSTLIRQPQIVNGGVVLLDVGKPAMQIISGYATMSTSFNVSLTNPQVFYVGKYTIRAANGYSGHWVKLGSGGTDHFISANGDAGTYQSMYNNTVIKYGTFNANLNDRYLEVYENTNSTTTRYLNNVSRGANNFTKSTPATLLIGGSDPSYVVNGAIQEIIIYATGNSANRSGIQTNINDFYSIY